MRRISFEQGNLLQRLNIDRDDPWVWVSTSGPVSKEGPAQFHVDAGDIVLDIPLTDSDREHWDGYSYEMLGLRVNLAFVKMQDEVWGWNGGTIVCWGDDLYVDAMYQRVRYQQSILCAEYVIEKHGIPDASIRGAMLKHSKSDRVKAWGAMDLLLKGPRQGRPPGPKRGTDAAYWLGRVAILGGDILGQPLARAEYYASTPRTKGRYPWWNDNVLRTIRRKRQRQ